MDVLLVPIHQDNHWITSSIHFQSKKLEVYDSLQARHPGVFVVKDLL
jgi:Ulp1 family protease